MADRVPKRVKLPWRPVLGYAEGSVVSTGPGDFWRVDRATIERHHRTWNVYLYLSPLNPGDVGTGWGEEIDPPPTEIEVL